MIFPDSLIDSFKKELHGYITNKNSSTKISLWYYYPLMVLFSYNSYLNLAPYVIVFEGSALGDN